MRTWVRIWTSLFNVVEYPQHLIWITPRGIKANFKNRCPRVTLFDLNKLVTHDLLSRVVFLAQISSKIPVHILILLRSEIPSSMCAKLRTVAPSNNRDHPTRSLYYCLFAPHTYIFVLRPHPLRGESYCTINATPPEMLQQYQLPNNTDQVYYFAILCISCPKVFLNHTAQIFSRWNFYLN